MTHEWILTPSAHEQLRIKSPVPRFPVPTPGENTQLCACAFSAARGRKHTDWT